MQQDSSLQARNGLQLFVMAWAERRMESWLRKQQSILFKIVLFVEVMRFKVLIYFCMHSRQQTIWCIPTCMGQEVVR